jgi:hypothetical protein
MRDIAPRCSSLAELIDAELGQEEVIRIGPLRVYDHIEHVEVSELCSTPTVFTAEDNEAIRIGQIEVR